MRFKKILSGFIILSYTIVSVSYALSPAPGSTDPELRRDMYAVGQKLFAEKKGPGAIDFGAYSPDKFLGNEPQIYGIKFQEADYADPPKGWENNPILKQTDLIEALRYFRDQEARIPQDRLEIIEGYFDVDEEAGEIPVSRIEKTGNSYQLVVHTKFIQMWNHIRENDIWFEANRGDGKLRTISLAWGIFYRLAKHEMADLEKSTWRSKSGGHVFYSVDRKELVVDVNERKANEIGGAYRMYNDIIWMWMLASYSFGDSVRYDNKLLEDRIEWLLDNRSGDIKEEFPQLFYLMDNPAVLSLVTNISCSINYNFFSREGIEFPKLEVDEVLIDEYFMREQKRLDKKNNNDALEPEKRQDIVSEYTPWYGENRGPGALEEKDIRGVWEAVNILNDSRIEIVLPHSLNLGHDIRKTLRGIKKRNRKDVVRFREFSGKEHLEQILDIPPEQGVKRIVITDLHMSGEVADLVKEDPLLFSDCRFLSMELPDDYYDEDSGLQSIQQSRVIMIAILARILEKGKTPQVEAVFRRMLKNYLVLEEGDIDEYIHMLVSSGEDSDTKRDIVKRVLYFLENPVSLVENLRKDIELLEEFWTAA